MPSTNFLRYARVPESSIGVTPATPAMQYAYLTGEGMKPTDPFVQSETIIGDRAVQEYLRVGQSVAGNLNFELAGGWSDFILELALFDRFAGGVEAYNFTADQNVTEINAQTLSAAGAWVPGMVVWTSGFGNPGNNKVFAAQSGSASGSVVAPSGTFVANETAPPAGARALFVGVEGASGDLVTAANGVSSTALNFTLFPIAVGAAVKIKGFDDARVDVVATVKSVAAGLLELDDLPSDWQTGLGAGKTVRIFIGEMIENGADVLTETHEKWNARTSPIAYERFTGVAVNQLTIPFEANQIVKPTAQLIGFLGSVSETALGASYADAFSGVTSQPMKTGANVARLTEGGATLADAACAQRLTLTIANNLTPIACLAHDPAVGYNEGDFKVTIDGVWRYRNKALIDKYHAGAPSKHLIAVRRGTWMFVFKIHAGVYTDIGALAPSRNQEHQVTGRFEAVKASDGKVMTISRFRYLE